MRILHVITSLYTGGAESLVSQIAPMIRDNGHHVEVACFIGKKTPFMQALTDKGITVHSFAENCSVYDPRIIPWLRGLMKNFDIVHTHNSSPQYFAAIAANGLDCRLVTTEHNSNNRRRKWLLGRMMDRWLFSRYETTICIAEIAEKNLRGLLGDLPGICTVNNGIDINRFANAPAIEEPESNGHKIITMVAGFRHQKDQDTLIRALALLPSRFVVNLAGTGERMQQCRELARTEGVEDRVRFLGLRMDVPAILKASDYVVMSSHYEGLSLSSVEGMASGRPMIASDVDGLREVVKDAGILFEHGNARQLADEILRLDSDRNYYDSIAERCRRRAMDYDISVMVGKYCAIYDSNFN